MVVLEFQIQTNNMQHLFSSFQRNNGTFNQLFLEYLKKEKIQFWKLKQGKLQQLCQNYNNTHELKIFIFTPSKIKQI